MGYWPDFNLESVFIFKNIFNMKNVTDFRKTVETGVDPHLLSVGTSDEIKVAMIAIDETIAGD